MGPRSLCTFKAFEMPSASPFGFAEPPPPANYVYKVGNTIPKAVHKGFEPFTFKRWNELGRPLVALKRSKFRANGERFYTLCKIMRCTFDCTYWLLEDVPNSMASATPNKGVLDKNAEEKGRLLISPYPDQDPIVGVNVPIVKGNSMAARPTGRIFRRVPRLEEESTEDEVSPAKRAHKRALEADSTEDEVKPAKCAPRRAMEDDSTEDEAPRVVVVSDDDDA